MPAPNLFENGDMRLRRNAGTTLRQDEIENCLNSLDMIRAEKIADAAVEPQIDVKIGKWVEILRSWPDDEAVVAGELYHRVQKIKKSSRIDMIKGEEIADAAVMPQIDVKLGKWAEILRSWSDDEAVMAGELYHRVQKIKKSSRIGMIRGEDIDLRLDCSVRDLFCPYHI